MIVEPLAMPAVKARALIKQLASTPLPPRAYGGDDDDAGKCADNEDVVDGYVVANGVATIPIIGVLTKYPNWPSWIDKWYGFVPATTVKATITKALADWTVKVIDFVIDCPGGLYAGTNELGDYIAKINGSGPGQKPCRARISDLAASGGYWIASQCGTITCNAGGFSGCIGVYSVLLDDSKFWEEMGISWELVSSGGVKGLGADGKISPELRADVQREIDGMFARFTGAVASGRKMTPDRAKSLGDGRVWIANEALNLGLIDQVLSVEDSMAAILEEVGNMPITAQQFTEHAAANPGAAEVQSLISQGKDQVTKATATAQELAGAFPNDPSFAMSQLTAGATLIAALSAGCKHQGEQLATMATKHAEALAAKDAAHGSAMAAKDTEIQQAKFEATGQRPINTAAKSGEKKPPVGAIAEGPEADAKVEWSAMDASAKSKWMDEDTFVRARKKEIEKGE